LRRVLVHRKSGLQIQEDTNEKALSVRFDFSFSAKRDCVRHSADQPCECRLHEQHANLNSGNVTEINTTSNAVVGTFPISNEPFGITFDGENIWVGAISCACVTKLRASDGTNLGSFPAGLEPSSMLFDGVNVWASQAGFGSFAVNKIRPSDGALIGIFTAGNGAAAMAFDGANVWVTSEYGTTVFKL